MSLGQNNHLECMADEPYITILPTLRTGYYLVCIMQPSQGDYVQGRVSQPLKLVEANSLAKCWSQATGYEVKR